VGNRRSLWGFYQMFAHGNMFLSRVNQKEKFSRRGKNFIATRDYAGSNCKMSRYPNPTSHMTLFPSRARRSSWPFDAKITVGMHANQGFFNPKSIFVLSASFNLRRNRPIGQGPAGFFFFEFEGQRLVAAGGISATGQ